MEHALGQLLHQFTYLALVGILAIGGLGVPVSEDLVLLISGAMAARGLMSFWPTLVTGYCGVLFGDMLIHTWGKRLGPAAWNTKRIQKALSPERQEKVRSHFARHGFLTIVVGRHTPILRAPVFFLAGASGVSRAKFLLADALSCAITVPLVTTLGYYFGEHFEELKAKIHHAQWIIGGVVLLGALVWLYLRRRAARSLLP